MEHNIAQISDVSETTIIGGLARTMRVVLSTDKLSAYGMSPMAIIGICKPRMSVCRLGTSLKTIRKFASMRETCFNRREDLEAVVVGVVRGHPVYLRDVADKIVDGAAEPSDYVSTVRRMRVRERSRAQRNTAVTLLWPSARDQRNRHLQRRAQARS